MIPPARLFRTILTSPLTWGALPTIGLYALIHGGAITGETGEHVHRFFTSHPVEYVMTLMFFTGMASLGLKVRDVMRQRRGLGSALLGPFPATRQPVEAAEAMLDRLDRAAPAQQDDYRTRRLRSALEYVEHRGSAEGLDEELKYLADQDAGEAYANYGLVRTITWCVPILGFLGTVIGIARAMGSLDPALLSESLPTVMAGLMVAFDTTTLALGLSIILVFSHFFVDRQETRLLADVDRRVGGELLGRFESPVEGAGGSETAVLRRLLEDVVQATQDLVVRQADIWRESIEAANTRFARLASDAGQEIKAALGPALSEGIRAHARELAAAEARLAEHQQQAWRHWQAGLTAGVESLDRLERKVSEQVDVLERVVDATGQVTKLEDRLNQNLGALAGVGNFEETVNSLAATIHLLNSRLTGSDGPKVCLDASKNKGNAA